MVARDACPEGGEHEFSADYEYDITGETVNCEKCGADEVSVNGQTYRLHERGNEPPELGPWRTADDLIQQGKLDEAARHVRDNVDLTGEPIESTLVYRVLLRIGHLLK